MAPAEKAAWAARYPDDGHKAAAFAWESWATTLQADPAYPTTGVVTSKSTGGQSVSYDGVMTAYDAAIETAQFHWARVRGAAVSSPDYPDAPGRTSRMTAPNWPPYPPWTEPCLVPEVGLQDGAQPK
jgi:hypothetical protein